MKLHKFKHAKTGNTVYLAESLIFAWYIQGETTYIVANGGASIPVSESPETVTTKLQGEKNDSNSNKRSDRPL